MGTTEDTKGTQRFTEETEISFVFDGAIAG